MNKELELLEAICRGVDPRDGTFLDTPRDPDLDKARLAYLERLRRMAKRSERKPPAAAHPPMHGKAWSPEDDSALERAWLADGSTTAEALAARFGRVEGAIIARLVHIGLFSDRDQARAANAERALKAKEM